MNIFEIIDFVFDKVSSFLYSVPLIKFVLRFLGLDDDKQ